MILYDYLEHGSPSAILHVIVVDAFEMLHLISPDIFTWKHIDWFGHAPSSEAFGILFEGEVAEGF